MYLISCAGVCWSTELSQVAMSNQVPSDLGPSRSKAPALQAGSTKLTPLTAPQSAVHRLHEAHDGLKDGPRQPTALLTVEL